MRHQGSFLLSRAHEADSFGYDSTNLIIILGMMQVSKKIPFEDPNVLNGCRALYIVSNLVIAGLYLYTQFQINKKKGACLLRLPCPRASPPIR
jgi:hypothetical protein